MLNCKIMTTEHPDWEQFCWRLHAKIGCCNLEEEHSLEDCEQCPKYIQKYCAFLYPDGNNAFRCESDFTHSKSVLSHIPGVTIKKSLEWFEAQSAFCDCEILFNIAEESPDE